MSRPEQTNQETAMFDRDHSSADDATRAEAASKAPGKRPRTASLPRRPPSGGAPAPSQHASASAAPAPDASIDDVFGYGSTGAPGGAANPDSLATRADAQVADAMTGTPRAIDDLGSRHAWLEARLAEADEYATLRQAGVLAFYAPGRFTTATILPYPDHLMSYVDWIERGQDGAKDSTTMQLLRLLPGSFGLALESLLQASPAGLYIGQLLDAGDTLGQLGTFLCGLAPPGAYLSLEEEHRLRRELAAVHPGAQGAPVAPGH